MSLRSGGVCKKDFTERKKVVFVSETSLHGKSVVNILQNLQ